MLDDVQGRDVLLLQGPMGPFFRRLAHEIEANGGRAYKLNFNGGDALFFRRADRSFAYRGPMEDFEGWFEGFLRARRFSVIGLFGDMRPLHRVAIAVAAKYAIPVYVFEEGYLRPDHFTCERHGVNGNSQMSRNPDVYLDALLAPRTDVAPVGHTFAFAALWSALYAIALSLSRLRFPNYRHHRRLDLAYQVRAWILGGIRRASYALSDRRAMRWITSPGAPDFFFVPLQVHTDAQLLHSEYDTVEDFMEEVVASFSEHAVQRAHLVIKHHPADRPFRDYSDFIVALRRRHGLEGRLHYVHDVHLPTLLRRALGTVTINSTVGLSSIHHDTPVKVLGLSVYDIPGLSCQRSLASFWDDTGEIDHELHLAFKGWLEHHNQANGSIWKRVDRSRGETGARWPAALSPSHTPGEKRND